MCTLNKKFHHLTWWLSELCSRHFARKSHFLLPTTKTTEERKKPAVTLLDFGHFGGERGGGRVEVKHVASRPLPHSARACTYSRQPPPLSSLVCRCSTHAISTYMHTNKYTHTHTISHITATELYRIHEKKRPKK